MFQARKLISDFAIILSILIFCGIDALVGVDTPKLIVPSEFKVCLRSFLKRPPSLYFMSCVKFVCLLVLNCQLPKKVSSPERISFLRQLQIYLFRCAN